MKPLFVIAAWLSAMHLDAQVDLALRRVQLSNSTFTPCFGSAPAAQLGNQLYVGATVENLGNTTGTSVMLHISVEGPVPFVLDMSMDNVVPGDSSYSYQPMPIPVLTEGEYMATFSIDFAESSSDINPSNNVTVRYFAIYNDQYALDGIDVIPESELATSSIGTASFPDAEDGLMVMSYMEIRTAVPLAGFEALLTTSSQAGSEIVFHILDTLEVLLGFAIAPIYSSSLHTVTPEDLAAGRVTLFIPPGDLVLAPGAYYVAAELYSFAGTDHVAIRDDETYPQNYLASLIAHPVDQTVYSNGNALAVRAKLWTGVGVPDVEGTVGEAPWPSPASDVLYFDPPMPGLPTAVRITDMSGHTVLTDRGSHGRMDISALAAGAYLLHAGTRTRPFVKADH